MTSRNSMLEVKEWNRVLFLSQPSALDVRDISRVAILLQIIELFIGILSSD